MEVTDVGGAEYRMRVEGTDYKTAEGAVEAAAGRAGEEIEDVGGSGEYHRESREDDE